MQSRAPKDRTFPLTSLFSKEEKDTPLVAAARKGDAKAISALFLAQPDFKKEAIYMGWLDSWRQQTGGPTVKKIRDKYKGQAPILVVVKSQTDRETVYLPSKVGPSYEYTHATSAYFVYRNHNNKNVCGKINDAEATLDAIFKTAHNKHTSLDQPYIKAIETFYKAYAYNREVTQALAVALENSKSDVVTALLNMGVNAPDVHPMIYDYQDKNGNTFLMKAVIKGDHATAKRLLESKALKDRKALIAHDNILGVDVRKSMQKDNGYAFLNTKNKQGETALSLAVKAGNYEMTALLLTNRNVSSGFKTGKNFPAVMALKFGRLDILTLFLNRKYIAENGKEKTLLYTDELIGVLKATASMGYVEMARDLIRKFPTELSKYKSYERQAEKVAKKNSEELEGPKDIKTSSADRVPVQDKSGKEPEGPKSSEAPRSQGVSKGSTESRSVLDTVTSFFTTQTQQALPDPSKTVVPKGSGAKASDELFETPDPRTVVSSGGSLNSEQAQL